MAQSLDEFEGRLAELNRQLADPSVIQDRKRFRDLTKEHQHLHQVVEAQSRVHQLEGELEGNREILAAEDDAELLEMAREEVEALEPRLEKARDDLQLLLLPRDPNDDKNVIIEIRSGTGGDEAALFAGQLFRMYSRFAEERGWRIELLSLSPGSQGGVKEAVALVQGTDAYSWLKFESGVHRVQRVPETESQGRIHTSACTVAVLPEAEDVDVDIQDRDLRIDVFRSSGPGGQSVNTTDSAVRITHLPTGLVVTCQDEKSQHKNKAKALKVLAARLLDQARAEQEAEMAAERRSMVKSGDRSDKIRTYNFPQDRVTDHRIGLTLHNLPKVMQGQIEDLILALRTQHQSDLLKQGVPGV